MTCCVSSWRSISWSDLSPLFGECGLVSTQYPNTIHCLSSGLRHLGSCEDMTIPFNAYVGIHVTWTSSFIILVLFTGHQSVKFSVERHRKAVEMSPKANKNNTKRSLDTRWCGIEPTLDNLLSIFRGFINHRAMVLSYVSLQHANMLTCILPFKILFKIFNDSDSAMTLTRKWQFDPPPSRN